ncbi:MAG TPA: carbohydrate ABC transporter permease, partial [Methylomirabilota bacterium]|nr:carbohydrate ABC transporter permease [Methylomirabilota bacterium]
MNSQARRRAGRGPATYVSAGLLLAVVLFPFLWLLQMSFRPNEDILGYNLLFRPTLEHYRALRVGHFPRSFGNSAIASVTSTLLSLLVGVPAAYALSRG